MNKFIESIIEETFKSKRQQRFFYAQAGKGGKKGKKWAKWAKEFSDKTDFDKLPETAEEVEVDEVVDKKGNIAHNKKPTNIETKGVTSNSTTDEVVKTGRGAMGSYGTTGVQNYRRYWGESDMSKALGADDTIMKDADYDDAKKHFEDELGIEDPKELEDRLGQMGYDKNLPDDKVRLVENPKKFVEEYIESLLKKKNEDSDLVKKEEEVEEVELNPIVKKQLKSLKNSMKTYGLKPDHIMKGLKDDE